MAKAATITANPRRLDLAGKKFGQWTVLHYVGYTRGMSLWRCRCDCRNEADVSRGNLMRGRSVSCGCYRAEDLSARKKTHGASGYKGKGRGPLYVTWVDMRRRCYTESAKHFRHYGGRGIRVCQRWLDGADGKTGYECFVADMGEKPSPKHSLERKDVDGNYEPGNCVWATDAEQARNTRANRWVEFRGKYMIMMDAIRASGLRSDTVYDRLSRGWSVERALSQPPLNRNWRRNAS